MANSFFTVAAISKELVRLMKNDLVLGKSVGTDNLENGPSSPVARSGAPPDAIPRPGQQPRSVGLLGRRDRAPSP